MAVTFPRVNGRALDGTNIALPVDLPAQRTLCLIAFRQWHQACVDRWITRAESAGIPGSPMDLQPGDDTCVLEIPVIGTQWRLGRRFIDGGMATSIRIPRVLARTVTVYTDVAAFQKSLEISGSGDVVAVVVTPHGEVLARADGDPTNAAWSHIAPALAITGGAS